MFASNLYEAANFSAWGDQSYGVNTIYLLTQDQFC